MCNVKMDEKTLLYLLSIVKQHKQRRVITSFSQVCFENIIDINVLVCAAQVNKEPITALEMPIDDLEEGAEYQFRVCAENAAGVGEPCDPIKLIAKDPFDPPEAPGNLNDRKYIILCFESISQWQL